MKPLIDFESSQSRESSQLELGTPPAQCSTPRSELPPPAPARSEDMDDDWTNCDAEAVVTALSVRERRAAAA